MSTMTPVRLGDKGRLVVPSATRLRLGWKPGVRLILVEDGNVVRLMDAWRALEASRASIAGTSSPVDELIAERRLAAQNGD